MPHPSVALGVLQVNLRRIVADSSSFPPRETVSHDWDRVHQEGKTMFRLPKECVTGHVEGWMAVMEQIKVTVLLNVCMLPSDPRLI